MNLIDKINRFENTAGTIEIFNEMFFNCPINEYDSLSDEVTLGEIIRVNGDVIRMIQINDNEPIEHLFRNDNIINEYEDIEYDEPYEEDDDEY